MLSKKTNLYYFQNQGKYDSSSEVLKWVDVSVVRANHKKKKKKGVKLGTFLSSALCRSTKGNVSRDIKPSSIIRSLGKCSLKLLVHKNY
jgi:hypothetical protein